MGGRTLARQLGQDRRRVEVDALADEPFAFELEDRQAAALERLVRRCDAPQLALVRAAQPELDEDGVVGVVQRDQLVALVGEAVRDSLT